MESIKNNGQKEGLPEVGSDEGITEEELSNVLLKIPDEQRPEVVRVVKAAMFSGPLPPPSMLKEYEQIFPGSANRMMLITENEQNIRKRDNGWMLFNDSLRISGSIAVSFGLIGGGIYCGMNGQPWLGGVIATSGAVAEIMRRFISNPKE